MYLCSWFLVDVVFAWDGPSYNIAYYLVIHPGQFKSVGTVADPSMGIAVKSQFIFLDIGVSAAHKY